MIIVLDQEGRTRRSQVNLIVLLSSSIMFRVLLFLVSVVILVFTTKGNHIVLQSFCKKMAIKLNTLIRKVNTGACCKGGNYSTVPTSCKEIYDSGRADRNRAYMLQMDTGKIPVYCHMSDSGIGKECGGGGWTLVMKITGSENTFHYDSAYWSNKIDYQHPEGATGFDGEETKLPTYWNTLFHKICLGIKIPGNETRFIVIEKAASSLYALIADGKYRATSLGRDKWKSLIGPEASLQLNCNREGFNARCVCPTCPKARIGYLTNQEDDCSSCDSRIGFGTGGWQDNSNTCGNEAIFSSDNGDKHIKAFGYILVK